MEAKKTVVFVQLGDSACVPELIPFVDQVHVVKKRYSDGSAAIAEWYDQEENDRPARPFGVCGVNTPYCVYDTVVGLYGFDWSLVVFESYCAGEEWDLNNLFSEPESAESVGMVNNHAMAIERLATKYPNDRITVVYGDYFGIAAGDSECHGRAL